MATAAFSSSSRPWSRWLAAPCIDDVDSPFLPTDYYDRRPKNKLRKSSISRSPPTLPPLSFIPDDPIQFLPSISQSTSTSASSSRNNLLRKNPPARSPSPPVLTRKLTKRRPSVSDTPPLPNRTQSDPVPASPPKLAPVQRASSLMTVRGFSLRRRKNHTLVTDLKPSPSTSSRWGVARWPVRSSASENGHAFTEPSSTLEDRHFLPPMPITPFHVNLLVPTPPNNSNTLPAIQSHPTRPAPLTLTLPGPHLSNSRQILPSSSDSTASPFIQDDPLPLPPRRAKFTLAPDPTPPYDPASPSSSSIGHGNRSPRASKNGPRWTLAMAMNDEGITDEVLVQALERIRFSREWSGDDLDDRWDVWEAGYGWGPSRSVDAFDEYSYPSPKGEEGVDHWTEDEAGSRYPTCKEDVYSSPQTLTTATTTTTATTPFPPTPSLLSLPQHPPPSSYTIPSPTKGPSRSGSSTAPAATWHAARRTLLICRELVRTERHYLTSLNALLAGETTTPPPPLMVRYARELVTVSELLLGRMEEDPSAWGVAAAFLAEEERVDSAFVGWCGVVGTWFVGGEEVTVNPKRRGSRTGIEEELLQGGSQLKRTMSAWRKSMPAITSLSVSVGVAPMHSPTLTSPPMFSSRRREKESAESSPVAATAATKRRTSAIRDLAILPTQRVMRYVLLYRDLLAHTPSTSPSRALVERAVEVASRVAQKCDRAQGNSAFLQRR